MADVAVVAGVSHQTVSRVLNDHPSVRGETRRRVLDAIATLGYRRNSAARTLVTRRSGAIGVVTGGSALYGPTGTLVALEGAARTAGYFVSVATVPVFDGDSMGPPLEHFLDQGVEGIVVIASQTDAVRAVADFDAPVPVVVVSSAAEVGGHVHVVGVDNRDGARQATRYLIDRGHRHIVHVAGPTDWFEAQDRVAGWREACMAAGLTTPEPVQGDWSARRGYEIGGELARAGAPEAVFAANDQLALGLLRAFWEHGVQVPGDVAVVGFDDEAGAAYYVPPLTTVRQDFAALGRAAISSLLYALDGRPVQRVVIPAQLVIRASAG